MKSMMIIQGTDAFNTLSSEYKTRIENSFSDEKKTLLVNLPAELDADQVLFVAESMADNEEELVGAAKSLLAKETATIELCFENHAEAVAEALYCATYEFLEFKSEPKPRAELTVKVDGDAVMKPVYLEGLTAAKNFVNTPSNFLTPSSYATEICRLMKDSGEKVSVTLLDENLILKEKMRSLHIIGKGSSNRPMVVVIEYKGGKEDEPYLALVGKGVTFDSGGISIKPSGGMGDMISDMAGSAAVVGAMKAIADNGVNKNIVSIVGLVENMPDAAATKPGDIVKTRAGKTVQILNTDAEGRMVLCDIMDYVQDKFNVHTMVDVATLTGAIVVALGDQYAGLYSNSTSLCEAVTEAGEAVGEKYWRMPMCKAYAKQLESKVADIKNIGNGHPGSATAAEFLKKFVKDDVVWAHLDIAGVAFDKVASGFGVKTLFTLASNFEPSHTLDK